jgi:outer membrane lipopolysaccharide assembly protein LptE/RlpB
MNMIRLIVISTLLAMLTACWPAYKTIKPEVRFLVADTNKKPIEGAKVVLNTRAYPTPMSEFDIQYTNPKGMTNFVAKKEMQVESATLHGARQYHWELCIEKTGFTTITKSIAKASELNESQIIYMDKGNSTACPTR